MDCVSGSGDSDGRRDSKTDSQNLSVRRSVVIKDSAFITWSALIFYLYTGHVHFLPLKSSGLEKRVIAKSIYSEAYPARRRPIPCSPKSMYRLAHKYGLKDLAELSLRNIEAQLSKTNIFAEYYTLFTATHPEVKTVLLRYVKNNAKGDKQIAYKAFEDKRKELLSLSIEHPEIGELVLDAYVDSLF